jgi:replicative DNA helicase
MKNELTQFMKLPPQANDVEVAVLGAILLESTAFELVSSYLNPLSFYAERHQKIYRAIENLKKQHTPIDIITVVEELKRSNDLESVGGAYEVVKLTNAVVSSANIEAHAKIVCEKAIMRNLIKASSEIINAAYEEGSDVFELLEYAENSIKKIGDSTVQGGMIGINSVIVDAIKKVSEWRLNDSTLTGIPTGFPELDRATRGWQNGDLIVIAARPSGGKTAMALNLIRNAALNDKKPTVVAAWSLEMKSTFLVLRMLAAESEIILHKIQTGRLSDDEMEKLISKGADVLSRAQIYFDENSFVTMKSLKAKARRLKKQNNLGLIVIDYLQLMSGEASKGNREQEISTISRELKNLAQELDVPIIALSQLSREGAKNVSWEVAPPPSALRESGAIEQDADVIIMLWGANEQEQAQDPYLEGKRKIRIVKQRNGVLLTLELDFRSEIQLFESIKNYF